MPNEEVIKHPDVEYKIKTAWNEGGYIDVDLEINANSWRHPPDLFYEFIEHGYRCKLTSSTELRDKVKVTESEDDYDSVWFSLKLEADDRLVYSLGLETAGVFYHKFIFSAYLPTGLFIFQEGKVLKV